MVGERKMKIGLIGKDVRRKKMMLMFAMHILVTVQIQRIVPRAFESRI